MSIDYNRGVVKRTTPNGVDVCEYKDAPGEYYDGNGNPLEDEIAAQAHFDILEGRKQRRRRELEREALAKADKQLKEEFDGVEEQLATEFGEAPPGPTIEKSEKPRKYKVVDAGGTVVADDLNKKAAEELLESLKSQ